jgi:hypothetical protein
MRNKELKGFWLELNDIPEMFKSNSRKEKFLQYDSGSENPNRFLIFASKF